MSDDQTLALEVLQELISAGTMTETDNDGSVGVRPDVWRAAIAAKGKEWSHSGWSNFSSRLVGNEFVSKFNGLVNLRVNP